MKRTTKRKRRYTIGSISRGTMRAEDLIPAFVAQLEYEMKYGPSQDRSTRKAHGALVREITKRMEQDPSESHSTDCAQRFKNSAECTCYKAEQGAYFDSDTAPDDLTDLMDALELYAALYFYFGAHPGDGADYGYWLSESWNEDFEFIDDLNVEDFKTGAYMPDIKVSDLSEVPSWFRGSVAVVNDHGNVTLYAKSARKLAEIWSVV